MKLRQPLSNQKGANSFRQEISKAYKMRERFSGSHQGAGFLMEFARRALFGEAMGGRAAYKNSFQGGYGNGKKSYSFYVGVSNGRPS